MAWADLTKQAGARRLIEEVAPTVVIHLAAVIPPFCYAKRELARAVNVDATEHLVSAMSAMQTPARLVLASSVAVYGARNPYRDAGVLTAATARHPSDLYGSHKFLAEDLVTDSKLDWVILRLGGVLTAAPRYRIDRDLVFFESVLPADGRIQTVDVRDAGRAFAGCGGHKSHA